MSEELKRDIPIPLYYQVSQIIRREIDTGKYGPGDYIPTEMELQERFNVSRATIRQALADLVYEGLLERRRSKGTIVAPMRVEETMQDLASFTNQVMHSSHTLVTRILDFKQMLAPEPVIEQLNIGTQDLVVMMERLRFVDNEAVAVEKWYAPVKYFPGLNRKFFKETGVEQSTYYVLMKHYGTQICRAADTISAVSVSERDARLLGLETEVPVLLRTRVSYGADNLPVTYASGVYVIRLNITLESNRCRTFELKDLEA